MCLPKIGFIEMLNLRTEVERFVRAVTTFEINIGRYTSNTINIRNIIEVMFVCLFYLNSIVNINLARVKLILLKPMMAVSECVTTNRIGLQIGLRLRHF